MGNHVVRSCIVFILMVTSLVITALPTFAQLKVDSTVSPANGSMNDDFIFKVVIDGAQDAPYPTLVGGDDFKLTLIGPEQTVQIVNGKVSKQIAYSYRLIPTRPGTLQTPTAEVSVDGIVYTTPPLEVTVSKGRGTGGGQSFFLRQQISKQESYRGEQLINTLDLYTVVEVVKAQFEELEYPQFIHKPVGRELTDTRNIDGKQYTLNRLKKALFPLSTGAVTLPARSIILHIKQARRKSVLGRFDPFRQDFVDSFFGAPIRKTRVISNALDLVIKEPPPFPADFPTNGLSYPIVGSVVVTATFDRSPVEVGESKTVTVEVVSDGYLEPLKSVELESSTAVRVYSEGAKENSFDSKGKLFTKKIFGFSVVPTRAGSIQLPPIRIGYFNPDKKQYELATTTPIAFLAKGGPATRDTATQPKSDNIAAEDAGLFANQYREETFMEYLSQQISLAGAALILAALALLGGAIYAFFHLRSGTRPLRKIKDALQHALSPEDIRELLLSYLTLLLFKEDGQRSRADIIEAFAKRPDRDSLEFRLNTVLDEIDARLFSPDSFSDSGATRLRDKALELINAID